MIRTVGKPQGTPEMPDSESPEVSQLHELIALHGRRAVYNMVPEKQRSLVDIAAEVLADEQSRTGFTYSGFCLTALPHRKLPDDEQGWCRDGHLVSLLIEPGSLPTATGIKRYGVPYGARARLILLYLQTEAVKTKSPEVSLGRSMRDWMEKMGIAYGGETARALREQAARISACNLKFIWYKGKGGVQSSGFQKGAIVESGLTFTTTGNRNQGTLWEDKVRLDPKFWASLEKHPVPLQEAAIRELRTRSTSLDIYVWLAWRLHTLTERTPVSWHALHTQFGSGIDHLHHFKPAFSVALAAALAAYPEARVEMAQTGVVLIPSPPAVNERPRAKPVAAA